MLNENAEAFVMHVNSLKLSSILIHLARKSQIVSLIAKEEKIPAKYSDILEIFSEKKVLMLLELIELNQYAIKLQKGPQPL